MFGLESSHIFTKTLLLINMSNTGFSSLYRIRLLTMQLGNWGREHFLYCLLFFYSKSKFFRFDRFEPLIVVQVLLQ